jgi:hypothetical protein
MSKMSQMDLSNIKFVAVDMDGTLLNANHELSDEFYPLFDQMKARHFVRCGQRAPILQPAEPFQTDQR